MQDNSISGFIREILLSDNEPTWSPTNGRTTRSKRTPEFLPDKDIDLWLKHNAPLSFEALADIRYALYHHCSRAEFTVSMLADDQFKLTGRHSALNVINDNARKYLLWRLRQLGRKKSWINALPRTKNPRY
jgi:hypothetical protein